MPPRHALVPLLGAVAAALVVGCSEPDEGGLFGGTGGGGGAGGGAGGSGSGEVSATTTAGPTTVGSSGVGSSGSAQATASSGGGCDPLLQFACASGGCIDAFYTCDGIVDCADGSDEAPQNPACGGGPSSSTGGPTGWTCDAAYYGAADGCDCGCGELDPDCPGQGAAACEYCTLPGSCALFGCEDIQPDQNWRCKP